jgi:predicted ribosomally synthesized peptide with SipW-like signal peptide
MSHDEAAQAARRRRLPAISSRARVLAAAGIAGAMLVAGSFAIFSDSGSVRTTFTAGTLDLKFDAAEDGGPTPYLVSFDGGDALAPDVTVTRDLVVYNSGSVPADLALGTPVVANTATGADLLQDDLWLTVEDVDDESLLYSGRLTAAAFTGLDLGSGGTTATGTVLRFSVSLDSQAGVAIAGQSVQVDFPFTASQQP